MESFKDLNPLTKKIFWNDQFEYLHNLFNEINCDVFDNKGLVVYTHYPSDFGQETFDTEIEQESTDPHIILQGWNYLNTYIFLGLGTENQTFKIFVSKRNKIILKFDVKLENVFPGLRNAVEYGIKTGIYPDIVFEDEDFSETVYEAYYRQSMRDSEQDVWDTYDNDIAPYVDDD